MDFHFVQKLSRKLVEDYKNDGLFLYIEVKHKEFVRIEPINIRKVRVLSENSLLCNCIITYEKPMTVYGINARDTEA